MTSTYLNVGSFSGPIRAVSHWIPLTDSVKIPLLGFGTYRLPIDKTAEAVRYAYEKGFRHFDCAPRYKNESAVGQGLKGIDRSSFFITSKLWPTNQQPDRVEKACRQTLSELRMDYLDLLLIHWPVAWCYANEDESEIIVDKDVTLSDTWTAMEDLVRKGLVRALGVCNCNIDDLHKIIDNATIQPCINQIECHPGLSQIRLRGEHVHLGMLTASYCPLGLPTRHSPPKFKGIVNDPFFKPLCENSGFTPARLLLNWNLDQNNIVIVKSANRNHIDDNAKAQKFALSESIRWMMSHYEDKVMCQRVMNPKGFKGVKDRNFFS